MRFRNELSQCFAWMLTFIASFANAAPIAPVFEGPDGIAARVFAPSCFACHSSLRTGLERRGAPRNLNWDVYDVARENAGRIVQAAVIHRYMPPAASGVPTLDAEQRMALLAWEDAGYPRSGEVVTQGATFNAISGQLHLPAIDVNGELFEARLQLLLLPESTHGMGFELLVALPTAARGGARASFVPATGMLRIPELQVLNRASPARFHASLRLVPGSSPWLFEVVTLGRLPAE